MPAVADVLNRVRQPFNVNSLAQAAARRGARRYRLRRGEPRSSTTQGLAQLEAGFDALGVRYVPSHANFVLAKVGDAARGQRGAAARRA